MNAKANYHDLNTAERQVLASEITFIGFLNNSNVKDDTFYHVDNKLNIIRLMYTKHLHVFVRTVLGGNEQILYPIDVSMISFQSGTNMLLSNCYFTQIAAEMAAKELKERRTLDETNE